MTARVFSFEGVAAVAIPCARPAREPALELERAARFALGCPGLARPAQVRWVEGEGALVVTYGAAIRRSLAEAVGEGDAARIGRWLSALATTLSALHDLGVAHGHLRAELIDVSGDELVVFGYGVEAVARVAGSAVGALPQRHLAPEQRTEPPSAASTWTDTYALGVIASDLIGPALRDERVEALLASATSETLARRPADLRAWARELTEAIRERQAAPPVVAAPPAEPSARAPEPEPSAAPPLPPEPTAAPPPAEPGPTAAQPEPQPPAAPPPPAPPKLVPPPPVSQRERSSMGFVVALIAGALLMVLGVAALFVVVVVRARNAPPAPAVTISAPDAGVPSFGPTPAPPAAPSSPSPHASDAGTSDPDASLAPPTPVPEIATADIAPDAVSAADALSPLPLDEQVAVWGEPDALVTLVLFGDLECPHTRRAIGVALALKKALGDDLRLAWRHRPLSGNSLARPAAELAAALHAEHGNAAFFRLLAELARDGDAPTEARMGSWIEAAGGDRAKVAAARSRHAGRVDRDLELAGRFDVRATPTWYLNGIRFDGHQALDALRREAQKELTVARLSLVSGVGATGIYAARVRKNLLGLGPDVALRTCPEVGDSPVRGGKSPLVTIVEFSDFQCPYCQRVQPTLERLLSRYGGDLQLVWKNLPLASHGRARPAAALALEAGKRGGTASFWRVHDLLFDGSHGLDDAGLEKIAGLAGLDVTRALEAVRRGDHDRAIDADAAAAKKLGAKGTPTFFLNGRKLEGAVSYARFSAMVQEEIDAARRVVDSGTPRAQIYAKICGLR